MRSILSASVHTAVAHVAIQAAALSHSQNKARWPIFVTDLSCVVQLDQAEAFLKAAGISVPEVLAQSANAAHRDKRKHKHKKDKKSKAHKKHHKHRSQDGRERSP